MDEHVMTAESAIRLIDLLREHGVDPCVGGGWAVDALLGRQTRRHSDLDVWLRAVDIEPLFVACASCGLDRVLPWPGDRPWNFVLHDGESLRVDLHFYEEVPGDAWHYGSIVTGETIPVAALAGHGTIAGTAVRCEAPEWSVRWHSGYPVRDVDRHDIRLLCEYFGFDLPVVYR
jgi:lincosamide nucleotidyltransferase A/C/D/E